MTKLIGTGVTRWAMTVCFAAVVFGTASRVEASCGDYLLHSEPRGAGVTSLVDVPEFSPSWPQPAPSLPSRTCSGPSCQRAPSLPANDRTEPVRSPNDDRWCVGPVIDSICCLEAKSLPTAGATRGTQSLFRNRLERPPIFG
jgi:hypothetical protein